MNEVCRVSGLHAAAGLGSSLLTRGAGPLDIPVFGARLAIHPFSGAASIAWYRYWHYVFLKRALERELSPDRGRSSCTRNARCRRRPPSRRDAIRRQKVVVAIHSDGSQADEWVDKKMLRVGSRVVPVDRQRWSRRVPAAGRRHRLRVGSRAQRDGGARRRTRPASLRRSCGTSSSMTAGPSERPRSRATSSPSAVSRSRRTTSTCCGSSPPRTEADHRYTLDLVGDGPCRRSLERLSKSLGLEGQVQVPGRPSDVRALLPGYRVYVHTSLRESLCMAIIEAMACELPVVAGADRRDPRAVRAWARGSVLAPRRP